MKENTYDISEHLTVRFADKESAVFNIEQLIENATYINEGNIDHVHQEPMTVSIDGQAFVQSGVGTYTIPIPLRFELVK